MGRKRLNSDEKRKEINLTIPSKVIEDFKKECEEKGEIPSHIVEQLIKDYLKK